jgi:hypothetical protein
MGVLSVLHLPRNSVHRERDRCQRNIEMKVTRIRDRITGVFDRDRMDRRILAIQETGDTENPIAVGASGIAADGKNELLERGFTKSNKWEKVAYSGKE